MDVGKLESVKIKMENNKYEIALENARKDSETILNKIGQKGYNVVEIVMITEFIRIGCQRMLKEIVQNTPMRDQEIIEIQELMAKTLHIDESITTKVKYEKKK